jgi:molybdate-binding protein/DNA-binding transcriptional regulator YhcF (GntR family)
MEEQHLYQQIIQAVRDDILAGRKKSGDRLPSIRSLTETWHCTPGTVHRAYKELASQGLVISRPGQGTHVADNNLAPNVEMPLRRARLVQKAQAFLLEVLTAGYSPEEVETSLRLALDQWRVIRHETRQPSVGILKFSGSHDLAVAWIASHFSEIAPGFSFSLNFSGSLGGLISLAEGNGNIAGCHLWDKETNTYNIPFVRRLLPNKRVALLTLAWRSLGLITSSERKQPPASLIDLCHPGLRFINRQPGSGTRVWLDAQLHQLDIQPDSINGYNVECQTHTDVARNIAEGNADVGLGVQTAAQAFGLNFIPLSKERYDLVLLEEELNKEPAHSLMLWLKTRAARQAFAELGGYDTDSTGELMVLD